MALLREAGYDRPIYLHGAMEKLTELYKREGIPLGETPQGRRRPSAASSHGAIVLCPPSAIQDVWSRKFPDPVTAFASGWMRVRARARQKGVELPLVISDHSDWDDLCRTILETGAERGLGHARAGGRAGPLVRGRRASGRSRCTCWATATTARPSRRADRRRRA